MSYAGLPAGFSVAEQPKPTAYHGLPEGFEVKGDGHGWGESLASAPGAALDEITGAVTGAGKFIASLPEDPLGYKIGRAIKAAPGAIRDELAGMSQYVRNLSAPQYRGSAPTFAGGEAENHPWLALTQGDTDPMKQAIATRPLALVGDAAMAAGLTAPGRAGLGMLTDAVTYPVRKTFRAIADLAPANRAENDLLEAARKTNSPKAIIAALEQNKSPVSGVHYSAAQATQDPAIAQLEKASRTNRDLAPAWTKFDTGQNTGMFNALQGVVDPATDEAVSAARAARAAATRYEREGAYALADQGSLEPGSIREGVNLHAPPIMDALTAELAGRHGAAAGAPATGNYIAKNIARGTEPAASTGEVRKTLADALNSRAGLDLGDIKSSVKSADAMSRALVGTIDNSLNRATGGMWQDYLDAFKANSKDVNSVQALNNIRAELAKKIEGGAVDGTGNPKITRAYLKQIIERHATNDFGATILPGPQGELDKILSTAQQLEAPLANYRQGATGGGGPDTAATLGLAAAGHLARKLGPIGRVMAALPGLGEQGGATMLAGLLQNPVDAANAIRTAATREAARKVKSTGVKAAALAAILATQPQQ